MSRLKCLGIWKKNQWFMLKLIAFLGKKFSSKQSHQLFE